MYLTPGSINGYSVDFLVDTGASAIALNADAAKRWVLITSKVKPWAYEPHQE